MIGLVQVGRRRAAALALSCAFLLLVLPLVPGLPGGLPDGDWDVDTGPQGVSCASGSCHLPGPAGSVALSVAFDLDAALDETGIRAVASHRSGFQRDQPVGFFLLDATEHCVKESGGAGMNLAWKLRSDPKGNAEPGCFVQFTADSSGGLGAARVIWRVAGNVTKALVANSVQVRLHFGDPGTGVARSASAFSGSWTRVDSVGAWPPAETARGTDMMTVGLAGAVAGLAVVAFAVRRVRRSRGRKAREEEGRPA